ncbi:Dps family protein [Sinisalibacter aestuarii]
MNRHSGDLYSRPALAVLGEVLNDTYRLIVKSHTYHWNVTGPLFYSIHKMTEEQYTDMFAAVDKLAERIRALGKPASVNFAPLTAEEGGAGDAQIADEMVKDLIADHESLAQRLRALVKLAEVEDDPATADLATERAAFHEEVVWMLRATAA